MLLDRGISNWQRRLGILALVVALVGVVIVWAWQTMPGLRPFPASAIWQAVQRLRPAGPDRRPRAVLACIRCGWWSGLSWRRTRSAFWPRSGRRWSLLLLHYAWVVRSNVAFEEASVQASQKLAEKLAAVRSGNWQAARKQAQEQTPAVHAAPHRPARRRVALEEPHQRRPGLHLAHLDQPRRVCASAFRWV